MFNPFKRIKELEDRLVKLEDQVSSIIVTLNKTGLQLDDLSVKNNNLSDVCKKLSLALKGNYELVKNVIDISSKH